VSNLEQEYLNLAEDIVIGSTADGIPKVEEFFKIFSKLAAENGDCPDLTYSPILIFLKILQVHRAIFILVFALTSKKIVSQQSMRVISKKLFQGLVAFLSWRCQANHLKI
jgi:hypothetical protein